MPTKRSCLLLAPILACGALWLLATAPLALGQDEPFTYTSSGDVSLAQEVLQHLGFLEAGSYKSGAVDGATSRGLLRFQADHTLRPTGELDWETMTQLLGHRPASDSDGDGVPDIRDKCPGTPAGAQVDERGCPKDSDHDGVPDGIDRCPDTPAGAKVDADGCPLDSDHDGVYDGLDRCPDTPRGAKVDERGCPRDSDHDGVPDGLDDCPDTPAGVKVDASGCPLDSDGDGVTDDRDRCPGTPRGVKVDANGCEEKAAFLPEAKKPLVLEGVTFETNSAVLKPESAATLDRVVGALKDHPEVHVEVGGHTDSTGNKAHNEKLSKARADSVRDYMVAHGIEASRLSTKGYGSSKPIADNKTAAGRARNRRVELTRAD